MRSVSRNKRKHTNHDVSSALCMVMENIILVNGLECKMASNSSKVHKFLLWLQLLKLQMFGRTLWYCQVGFANSEEYVPLTLFSVCCKLEQVISAHIYKISPFNAHLMSWITYILIGQIWASIYFNPWKYG